MAGSLAPTSEKCGVTGRTAANELTFYGTGAPEKMSLRYIALLSRHLNDRGVIGICCQRRPKRERLSGTKWTRIRGAVALT